MGKAGGEIARVFKEGVVKLPVDGEIVVEFECWGPRDGTSATFLLCSKHMSGE